MDNKTNLEIPIFLKESHFLFEFFIRYDNKIEIIHNISEYNGPIIVNIKQDGKNIFNEQNDVTLFEGNIRNGLIEGFGILNNGFGNKVYVGEFKNNNYHGNGTLYYRSGNMKKYEGLFKNGHFIEGSYYDESGSIINGKFIKGLDKYNIQHKMYGIHTKKNKDRSIDILKNGITVDTIPFNKNSFQII